MYIVLCIHTTKKANVAICKVRSSRVAELEDTTEYKERGTVTKLQSSTMLYYSSR